MAQIELHNIGKTFWVAARAPGLWGALRGVVRRRKHSVCALAGVSFTLEAGELVGYIGPNGAGKSTTVKIMSGILVPDHGTCQVRGRVPWLERARHVAEIGVVFGQRSQLWWDLPVLESFELLRDIYRVAMPDYLRARDELVGQLGLEPLLDIPVRQLSLGQRMRCDLAASLLHAPSILFLDEPTIGLDAPSKLAVREFVKRLNRERGVTVILTTHDMDDIEALCTRVMLIAGGQLLSDGPLQHLRQRFGRERWLTVDLAAPAPADGPAAFRAEDFGARLVRREGARLCLAFDPEAIRPAELIARVAAQHAVHDLFVENPPIEEIITKIYGEHGAAEAAETQRP